MKSGPKKLGNMLRPFDVEFRPFIEEIDAKEVVIRVIYLYIPGRFYPFYCLEYYKILY